MTKQQKQRFAKIAGENLSLDIPVDSEEMDSYEPVINQLNSVTDVITQNPELLLNDGIGRAVESLIRQTVARLEVASACMSIWTTKSSLLSSPTRWGVLSQVATLPTPHNLNRRNKMLSFEAELNKRPIRVKYESDKPTRRVKPDPIDIRADAAFLWWQQHVESTRFDDHKRAILDMEWYGIMHGWFVRNGGFLVPTYTGRKALGLPQLKAAKAAA